MASYNVPIKNKFALNQSEDESDVEVEGPSQLLALPPKIKKVVTPPKVVEKERKAASRISPTRKQPDEEETRGGRRPFGGNVASTRGGGNVAFTRGGGNVAFTRGGGNVAFTRGGGNVAFPRGGRGRPYIQSGDSDRPRREGEYRPRRNYNQEGGDYKNDGTISERPPRRNYSKEGTPLDRPPRRTYNREGEGTDRPEGEKGAKPSNKVVKTIEKVNAEEGNVLDSNIETEKKISSPIPEKKLFDEEPETMTLEEFRAIKDEERRLRRENVKETPLRKAGEGVDPSQWEAMTPLIKKDQETTEEEVLDFGEFPQRVGRQKKIQLDISFAGRTVNRGRGRGRGRGGYSDRQVPKSKAPPKVDDEKDFPSLA